ncbi:TIGR02679 family protein [Tumebacillus permanentifrigoris]|uniref:Uncharacterized protein (TIGR02679 family) n=1 Tax=Tumebacillus permanentifrigoris TaxID=378543 RepID=A0A316D2G4_9BACL|nr:TIGR02679 family protein [Tumebacillus permanentifrigoris]PWK04932.1 uncharacterized protein (TIGR02679 family) [Tumebacillus permanentifrigoris]
MLSADEVKKHFIQPGYRRLFEAVRRKMESMRGRVAGRVVLEQLTEEECSRLSGLLGIPCLSEDKLTVKLPILERRMLESRWRIGLAELVPLVTGTPLVSNHERREQKLQTWEQFCDRLAELCLRTESCRWVEKLRAGEGAGTRTLKSLLEDEEQRAFEWAALIVRAVDELPCWEDRKERLPVFGNRLCGDPHVFDGDQQLGRLLHQVLSDLFDPSSGGTAERKRELMAEAGLMADDLSSQVFLLGLKPISSERFRPIFDTFYEAGIPVILPLAAARADLVWESVSRVYVVENPSVFQTIVDAWPSGRAWPAVMCTSGQPSVAALKVLDALVEKGSLVFYSGDFDRKGLEMASSFQKRYPESFCAWRMGSDDYVAHDKGLWWDKEELRILSTLSLPWDELLIETIQKRKLKVFQESFVERLIKDLLIHF